jgi:Nitronate monooxygenase
MRRRIIVATGKISLMPPAVWPAQRIHSCWRPAWVVETIWPRNRSRSRRASSRFALHSLKKAVGRDRGIVGKPFVPGIGLMSLSTSTLMTSSDWAAVIASFHSFGAGAMALVPQVVDAVSPIPVVAAGGIFDGRGIAAALMLGAAGVKLGTRFITSFPEARSAIDQRTHSRQLPSPYSRPPSQQNCKSDRRPIVTPPVS